MLDYLENIGYFQQDIPLTAVFDFSLWQAECKRTANIKTAYPDSHFSGGGICLDERAGCHTKKEVEIITL